MSVVDFEPDIVDVVDVEVEEEPTGRNEDLTKKKRIRDQLLDVFHQVEEGFTNQIERANDIMDYWDIYNCKLGPKQFYNGNSQIFVPVVHNAINARKTRFTNQIFPKSGRYIEATTDDGTLPQGEMSLIENYVDLARLRTDVLPALIRSGDVEGQYNVYVSWNRNTRYIARRVEQPVEIEGLPVPGETMQTMEEAEIEEGYPEVEILADTDVLVLPATADSLQQAIAAGGSVTIIRRWGKGKIRQMVREGALSKSMAETLLTAMDTEDLSPPYRNKNRQMAEAAGIRTRGAQRYALVYETWTMVRISKNETRLCQAFYGGDEQVIGARRNPLWCDRLPIVSVPVEKVAGSFKGQSKVKFCADMQYAANDAVNEGMDSAAYALMPIVMTDPEKNPRVGSMVLAMAAVWETSPQDTQFAQFPKLWQDAFQIVASCKAEISTTLSVSPAAITQQNPYGKLTQAEIANEQQVDIMTTADSVTVLEQGVLTPVVTLFAEMDHQYRDRPLTVRRYGEMGLRANMESVPPLQIDRHYQFRWFGVEAARTAQQIQQQIAAVNVVRGLPPQAYPGYKLDLAPVIVQLMENVFGPRLAPLVFQDARQQQTIDPQLENDMLLQGFDLPVHPPDDDPAHMQVHMQALQQGDVHGTIRAHLVKHQQQMQAKALAQQMQAMQPPGAGPAGGGGPPGAPRIGAQPGQATGTQNPPGAIHPDNMVDPSRMPQ